jgi:type VI protein secretion system component Hcp
VAVTYFLQVDGLPQIPVSSYDFRIDNTPRPDGAPSTGPSFSPLSVVADSKAAVAGLLRLEILATGTTAARLVGFSEAGVLVYDLKLNNVTLREVQDASGTQDVLTFVYNKFSLTTVTFDNRGGSITSSFAYDISSRTSIDPTSVQSPSEIPGSIGVEPTRYVLTVDGIENTFSVSSYKYDVISQGLPTSGTPGSYKVTFPPITFGLNLDAGFTKLLNAASSGRTIGAVRLEGFNLSGERIYDLLLNNVKITQLEDQTGPQDTLALSYGKIGLTTTIQENGRAVQKSFSYDTLAQTLNPVLTAPSPTAVNTTKSDFNSDSTSDVVLQNSANGDVSVWLLANNALVATRPIGSAGGYTIVGTGDFNRDGTSDLLFQDASGQVGDWIVRNSQYSSYINVGNAGNFKVAGSGDFNGDGTSDIVFQDASGNVANWTMQNGQFASYSNLGNASGYKVVGVVDFNGDGTSDLVFQSAAGQVAIWTLQNGRFQGYSNVGNAGAYRVVGTGDLNGDGTSDLVLQDQSTGQVGDWIIQNAAFQSYNNLGNAGSFKVVGTGDYNGDRTTDILLQNAAGDVAIWGVKNGTFSGYTPVGNASGLKAT